MQDSNNAFVCDGCGLPASLEHIEERIRRLELATKYRPIHINLLFVTLSPPRHEADDFYGPPESKEFFDPFFEALEIPSPADKAGLASSAQATPEARFAEFQHRGYYLVHLCECPTIAGGEPVSATISRLEPTLIRRIRYNYRPKSIALLGSELTPLVEILRAAGIGPLITTPEGSALPIPTRGDRQAASLVRKALSAASHREISAAGL